MQGELTDILAAAKSVEREIVAFDARNNDDLDTAFATFVQRGAAALVVGAFPFLVDDRRKIVMLAARHKLPVSIPRLRLLRQAAKRATAPMKLKVSAKQHFTWVVFSRREARRLARSTSDDVQARNQS